MKFDSKRKANSVNKQGDKPQEKKDWRWFILTGSNFGALRPGAMKNVGGGPMRLRMYENVISSRMVGHNPRGDRPNCVQAAPRRISGTHGIDGWGAAELKTIASAETTSGFFGDAMMLWEEEGVLPTCILHCKLVCVPKKDQRYLEPKQYRPIFEIGIGLWMGSTIPSKRQYKQQESALWRCLVMLRPTWDQSLRLPLAPWSCHSEKANPTSCWAKSRALKILVGAKLEGNGVKNSFSKGSKWRKWLTMPCGKRSAMPLMNREKGRLSQVEVEWLVDMIPINWAINTMTLPGVNWL